MVRDRGERRAEAQWLAAKCHFIVDYLADHISDPAYASIAAGFHKGIDAALEKTHVPALKMAYRDLRQQFEDLRPADREDLEDALSAMFGVDVAREIRDEIVVAQSIIRRGIIANADEYALLRAYVEQHLDDVGDSRQKRRAYEIVSNYEATLEPDRNQ